MSQYAYIHVSVFVRVYDYVCKSKCVTLFSLLIFSRLLHQCIVQRQSRIRCEVLQISCGSALLQNSSKTEIERRVKTWVAVDTTVLLQLTINTTHVTLSMN